MRTSRAVIPTFNMAIGLDVASTYFTPIWTRFLIAPLSLSFHRASPRLGRCAKHNSKTGFPGLEAQHLDVERLVMQAFVGTAPWDHWPLIMVLVGQVVERLGEPDGIIAFDPSSFPKRGTHAVAVK